MSTIPDVVVVGAGAAGLAAASELARAGLSVSILEARERIGGRMFTQRDPVCQVPIELGAEFIHGMPPEIWQPLQARNVRIMEVTGEPWCYREGRLSVCDFFSQVDEILKKMDASSPDESFLSFLDRCCNESTANPKQEEAKKRALAYVTGFNAADPGRVGVHWLVQGMRAEEAIAGDRAFRSRNGYEDLLDTFREELKQANVKTQTETVVESVEWTQGRVDISARRGGESFRLTTKRLLVTLSLGVLQAAIDAEGAVRFHPELPNTKLEALQKLEMGKVVRMSLRFRHRFWETIPAPARGKTLSEMSFLFSEDDWFPTWWTAMPEKLPIITGWAPFRCAERLSGKSRSFVIERCLHTLSGLLGIGEDKLAGVLDTAYFHDWQSDPFARGAYSYGAVGSDGAQKALASPVANTLFFAGEATDTTGHNGTVHGAIASGRRAAKEILGGLR